jgi:CRISPR/Cas system CMR-associated protein Cmr1 (group 7 of RAMP superfamily)
MNKIFIPTQSTIRKRSIHSSMKETKLAGSQLLSNKTIYKLTKTPTTYTFTRLSLLYKQNQNVKPYITKELINQYN